MRFSKVIFVVILTVATVMAGCKKEQKNAVVADDHEFVDLDLPSGALWAKCNVGATNPEDVGDYFAWGETATKDFYDWKQYKYSECVDGSYLLNKYCTEYTGRKPSKHKRKSPHGAYILMT